MSAKLPKSLTVSVLTTTIVDRDNSIARKGKSEMTPVRGNLCDSRWRGCRHYPRGGPPTKTVKNVWTDTREPCVSSKTRLEPLKVPFWDFIALFVNPYQDFRFQNPASSNNCLQRWPNNGNRRLPNALYKIMHLSWRKCKPYGEPTCSARLR